MIFKNRFIYSLVILFIVTSCINQKKFFTYHKLNPIDENGDLLIRLDGAYAAKHHAYFFYLNGLVKSVGLDSSEISNYNWQHKDTRRIRSDKPREQWGHYISNGQNISIEIFNHHNQEIIKRRVDVVNFDIINTNFLTKNEFFFRKDSSHFINKRIDYKFIKTINKPDSTKPWFRNKKWYRANKFDAISLKPVNP